MPNSAFNDDDVTIEKCMHKIPNRFDLVLVATMRIKMLLQGHTPKVVSKHKPGILSLREIEAGLVGEEMLNKIEV